MTMVRGDEERDLAAIAAMGRVRAESFRFHLDRDVDFVQHPSRRSVCSQDSGSAAVCGRRAVLAQRPPLSRRVTGRWRASGVILRSVFSCTDRILSDRTLRDVMREKQTRSRRRSRSQPLRRRTDLIDDIVRGDMKGATTRTPREPKTA